MLLKMAGLLLPFTCLFFLLGAAGCYRLFKLGRTGTNTQRVVSWVLIIPCILFTLLMLIATIAIMNPPANVQPD
jgi:hypothetical protein